METVVIQAASLRGSQAQIKWAGSIRAKVFSRIDNLFFRV